MRRYYVDGLSAAGLRVILHPLNEEGLQGGFDRVLWSTKDPTNQKWLEAEVLYTFNTDHQVTLLCLFYVSTLSTKVFILSIFKAFTHPAFLFFHYKLMYYICTCILFIHSCLSVCLCTHFPPSISFLSIPFNQSFPSLRLKFVLSVFCTSNLFYFLLFTSLLHFSYSPSRLLLDSRGE